MTAVADVGLQGRCGFYSSVRRRREASGATHAMGEIEKWATKVRRIGENRTLEIRTVEDRAQSMEWHWKRRGQIWTEEASIRRLNGYRQAVEVEETPGLLLLHIGRSEESVPALVLESDLPCCTKILAQVRKPNCVLQNAGRQDV